jgi:hypothetical protein
MDGNTFTDGVYYLVDRYEKSSSLTWSRNTQLTKSLRFHGLVRTKTTVQPNLTNFL